jgi:hypothetical protein
MVSTVILMLSLSSCDGLLDVEVPGRLPADALDDPGLVEILVASVQADFECAYASFAAFTGLFTDEWMSASSLGPSVEATDKRAATVLGMGTIGCSNSPTTSNPGYYQHLHVARSQGETAFRILSDHPDNLVPDKSRTLAVIAAYTGYALTLLGEGFCAMAIDEGPVMQPSEVLRLAEARFSTAIELAGQAGADDVIDWASVGRARVRVNLGDNAGALSDAQQVPQGFVKNATYDATPGRRVNRIFALNLGDRQYSLDVSFRNLEVEGVPDTRLEGIDAGVIGSDGVVPIWSIKNRFLSFSEPIPLANWEEAQLIIAEIQGGQAAVDAINRLRDAASLPNFSSTDPAQIRAEWLEERRRVLFGQAHRISDIIRFPELQFRTGARPQKIGDFVDLFQCLPLPDVERDANPNL